MYLGQDGFMLELPGIGLSLGQRRLALQGPRWDHVRSLLALTPDKAHKIAGERLGAGKYLIWIRI